ncbi:TrkA family potassium uptake protein [Bacteroides sp. 519]|uniref:potassium channel family protein n=1 Tax=Bacteroides sp. 519 TaxID=2302937 RepID=UPI0013D1F661|nr:TrkA family potassium uptake protein [Bacteroides sp. 519]NDV56602.1 TrkA family potassium uptake protein [Bacteroides sp. 519]
MKYIVIGLGNYGHVLAEELANLGHEVIGADINTERVEAIKDKIATAFTMDARDESALSVLPLKTVDVVMVTVGDDLGASIRVIALLKQMKVEHIYARAIDDVHKAILEVFNIDKILTPEEDAARGLVQLMNYGTEIESFPIDREYYVMKFVAPATMVNKYINDLRLEDAYNLKLIALTRKETRITVMGKNIENRVVPNLQENERIQEPLNQWKFVPEDWAKKAGERDYKLLFE